MTYEQQQDRIMEEQRIDRARQRNVIRTYANKAKVDPEWLIKQVENGACTVSDLAKGILGVRIA